MLCVVSFFFFFKQKTAYEMRISDWSSDVCSSDLYQCAVMERPLLRLLDRLGIRFTHIGPLVEYHGRRQPYMLKLETMLQEVREEQIGRASCRERVCQYV